MFHSINNNRGQVLVLVAVLGTFVLLGFAALAIDIGYFYHAKNQLQGAADAAALAGASRLLDNPPTPTQLQNARQEAWKFACLNKAVGSNVYLVTSKPDCNASLSSGELNGSNVSTGDIVMGNWNQISSTFTSTGTPINAIQAAPKRSASSPATGGPVGTFFGKIFNIASVDIGANAIAMAATSPKKGTFALCDAICGTKTPLTGTPPGTQVFMQSSPYAGWTSWLINGTNKNTVIPYWDGSSALPTKYCGLPIHTTNGVVNSTFDTINTIVSNNSATYVVKGRSIFGYKVLTPVFAGCTNPGVHDPNTIAELLEVIITKVIKQGGNNVAGFYIVGTGDCATCTVNESALTCAECDSSEAHKMDSSTLVK